jgi:Protein of unknown function (DUF3047)
MNWVGSGVALGRNLVIWALFLVGGCAQIVPVPAAPEGADTTRSSALFAPPNDPAHAAWHRVNIRFKTPTVYSASMADGAACIRAEADGAWSLVVATVPPATQGGNLLSWRWRVPAFVAGADNLVPGKDDAAVRVVVAFKGDRGTLDAAERATMSLAKALGGNELPYAAIQYIWEANAPVETIAVNGNTSRIKKIVVKSGADGLNAWQSFSRDVRADFRRAFPGEEPGDIESIGLMSDTDTLGGKIEACYADIQFR